MRLRSRLATLVVVVRRVIRPLGRLGLSMCTMLLRGLQVGSTVGSSTCSGGTLARQEWRVLTVGVGVVRVSSLRRRHHCGRSWNAHMAAVTMLMTRMVARMMTKLVAATAAPGALTITHKGGTSPLLLSSSVPFQSLTHQVVHANEWVVGRCGIGSTHRGGGQINGI